MRLDGKVALVTGSGQGFSQAIANCFAKEGAHVIGSDISVNGIAPPPIEFEVTRAMHVASGTQETCRFLIPMHRYGEVDEIAAAATFLAGDDARYVNDHILNVDGRVGAAALMYSLPRSDA